jgi:hypothetical protein
MKKIVRLTELDLTRIVKRVIKESNNAMVSQMNSNVSKSSPTGCKGMLLQNYNTLKTSLGRPMDGGCIADGLYVQWPKGSTSMFKGWQVQYNGENSGDTEVIVFMDYNDNRKIRAVEDTNFYSGAKVYIIKDETGSPSQASIVKKYGYDDIPLDDLDELLDIFYNMA